MLHERHHGAAQGRRLLASRDRAPLARLDAVELARDLARPTPCCPSCRCSTRMRGASRSPARWSARSRSSPARTSTPVSLLDAFVEQEVTLTAGVPTIWMGILQMLDAEPGRLGSLAAANDDRRRLGSAAGDDRGLPAPPRPPHHPRLGHDRDGADGHDLVALEPRARALRRRAVRLPGQAGSPRSVRRDSRPRRRGARPLGRCHDGRARGARPVDLVVVLRRARGKRSLDRGRLVQDRRHRHDRAPRLRRDPGSLEGPRQVGRRVDLHRRARERPDGPPRRRRGGRDRGAGRQVVGAPAGRDRVPRGADGRRTTSCGSSSRPTSRSGGCRSASRRSTRSRRRPWASSARQL